MTNLDRKDFFWVCQNCGHEFPNPSASATLTGCPECGQMHVVSGTVGRHAYKKLSPRYYPKRGDERELRLVAERDRHHPDSQDWDHWDRLLNRHRECADYGLAFDEDGGDP